MNMDAEDEGPGCLLYLLTPPKIDLATFPALFETALDAGEIGCVQLRLKDVSDDEIKRAVEALMPLAHARDLAFIMNDRPDLAKEMGCDGVHVGRDDMGYRKARAIVGPDATVGVTCHNSRHLAMTDAEAGADYVAFGAFFPTTSKDAQHVAEIETLEWWATFMNVPCVAIGGINADNCGPLVEAGADFLAVIAAVWNHPDGPAAGVKAMNKSMEIG
ncbi:MAG: thiamine phosphate synthase [Alphaproteobacteria bacterium]